MGQKVLINYINSLTGGENECNFKTVCTRGKKSRYHLLGIPRNCMKQNFTGSRWKKLNEGVQNGNWMEGLNGMVEWGEYGFKKVVSNFLINKTNLKEDEAIEMADEVVKIHKKARYNKKDDELLKLDNKLKEALEKEPDDINKIISLIKSGGYAYLGSADTSQKCVPYTCEDKKASCS